MSALLVVDVQHDFLTGSLAVPHGEEILPAVYELLERDDWDLVVASQVQPRLSSLLCPRWLTPARRISTRPDTSRSRQRTAPSSSSRFESCIQSRTRC
jgi:nicotinamidase-related amidase